jgi:uncharacterized membrane-anchored protein
MAQEAEETEETAEMTGEEYAELFKYFQTQDSIEKTFKYDTGMIVLNDGAITLNIPKGFRYLNSKQSKIVLEELWGNPPAETFGLIIQDTVSIFDDNSYAINVTYDESGYVKDEDAADIDYDELLKGMQEDIENENDSRKELGFQTYELVGWASAPYYDAAEKKLHWAKDLLFEGDDMHTLNYSIRILGRKGVLEMNFISGIDMLDEVKAAVPQIISSVNFNEGNRYADFNPEMDKVAAYGIGGLIAGKLLAKAGFFALLLKFWKVLALAVVGGAAAVRRFFGGKGMDDDTIA